MAVYVRLKDGETVAPYLFGKFIYPKEKRWIKYEDRFGTELQKDNRLEFRDQQQMDEEIQKTNESVDELVNMQWKRFETHANKIEDVDLLKRVLAAAKVSDKKMIVKITQSRIEELTTEL